MSDVYDYGLLIPSDTNMATMPPALREQIKLLGAEFPSFPAINTRFFSGKGIVYMRLKVKKTKAELEALFALFSLNWVVIAMRSAYKIVPVVIGQDELGEDIIEMQYDDVIPMPNDGSFLNFANDVIDNMTGLPRRPTTADDIYVSTYAGTDPIKL